MRIRASSTGRPAWRSATATHRLVTSAGGDVVQRYRFLMPGLTRHRARPWRDPDPLAQRRSRHLPAGRRSRSSTASASSAPARASPRRRWNCWRRPIARAATMDVLLAPDQMILQIHESIGHPLELDRILGDERNFAGTSFVTPRDVRHLPLRVASCSTSRSTPRRPEELASYAFDDEGTPAEKVHLIRDGILERPLGGAISQARAGLPGVANCPRRQLESPADRSHGQPQPRAGRRVVRRPGGRHRARRADGDQLFAGRSTTPATSSSSAASAAGSSRTAS